MVLKRKKRVPRPPAYPMQPSENATHWRIKKQGTQGEVMTTLGEDGVEILDHPLAEFTAEKIAARWGYSRNYWVQFCWWDGAKRRALGGFRELRLIDPRGEPSIAGGGGDPVTEVVPTTSLATSPTSALSDGITSVRMLKELVSAESNARIASDREFVSKQTETMFRMIERFAPPANAGPDPLVVQTLGAIGATLERVVSRLDALEAPTDPEDDEPEDDDDAKVERVVKEFKKHGFRALRDYFGEETIESIVRHLPKLKHQIPAAIAEAAPLIKAKMAQIAASLDAPAVTNPTNGTAAPKAKGPAPDAHTVRVV